MATVAHTLSDSATLSVSRNVGNFSAGMSTATAVVPAGEMWIVQLLSVIGSGTGANSSNPARVGWGLSNGVETLDGSQSAIESLFTYPATVTPFGGSGSGPNGSLVTSSGTLFPSLIGSPGQTITARAISYVNSSCNITVTYRIFKFKLFS